MATVTVAQGETSQTSFGKCAHCTTASVGFFSALIVARYRLRMLGSVRSFAALLTSQKQHFIVFARFLPARHRRVKLKAVPSLPRHL